MHCQSQLPSGLTRWTGRVVLGWSCQNSQEHLIPTDTGIRKNSINWITQTGERAACETTWTSLWVRFCSRFLPVICQGVFPCHCCPRLTHWGPVLCKAALWQSSFVKSTIQIKLNWKKKKSLTFLIIIDIPQGEILRGAPDQGKLAVTLCFLDYLIIAPTVVNFSPSCLLIFL